MLIDETKPAHPPRRMIDVKTLAAMLDKSVSSVWAGVAAGTIPRPVKIMGATRWDLTEIHAWLDGLMAARKAAEAEGGEAA